MLADIDEGPMKAGVARYGLAGYRVIAPDGRLPFEDGEFDAVWCNSVIEHVTLGRRDLATLREREFSVRADAHQRLFAQEVARVGRGYFVQTPYAHFPIEAHAWLPFVQYFPQETRWWLSRNLGSVWIKQWIADYNLYDVSRFRAHFPSASIQIERVFGIPKSLIATRVMA
jgi:SAM-dependent methyltransferase